jgi:hypothetical protein
MTIKCYKNGKKINFSMSNKTEQWQQYYYQAKDYIGIVTVYNSTG